MQKRPAAIAGMPSCTNTSHQDWPNTCLWARTKHGVNDEQEEVFVIPGARQDGSQIMKPSGEGSTHSNNLGSEGLTNMTSVALRLCEPPGRNSRLQLVPQPSKASLSGHRMFFVGDMDQKV